MSATIISLLVAFGGGIFGAALGALSAFAFVGFLTLIGVALTLGIAPDATSVAQGAAAYFGDLPFGAFGPHVGGFASGIAAAAYAAHKGYTESGRDIITAGMGLNRPDVLLVGGIFGVLGYILCCLIHEIPDFGPGLAWTDYPGICVVISAIIVRLIWGKTGIFGKAEEGRSFFDPSDAIKWLPFMSSKGQIALIGAGVGLLGGWMGITYGGVGVLLAFGVAAASLILLSLGLAIPVTHHIALPSAIAGAASGSILWGLIVGIICAFVGELCARLFLVHGDTHIDPPATAIAIMTFVLNGLTALGFWALIPLPV
jgi:hypothetical protein